MPLLPSSAIPVWLPPSCVALVTSCVHPIPHKVPRIAVQRDDARVVQCRHDLAFAVLQRGDSVQGGDGSDGVAHTLADLPQQV